MSQPDSDQAKPEVLISCDRICNPGAFTYEDWWGFAGCVFCVHQGKMVCENCRDRAIEAIEVFQLPAPKFIRGDDYTRVIMFAPMPLTRMNVEDRIRACYQHTCLHYVNSQPVNNQSVRKRFKIGANNSSFASKIISETVASGLIKSSDTSTNSKKYATHVPFWA